MLTTADSAMAERARLLREHGTKVRYHHEAVVSIPVHPPLTEAEVATVIAAVHEVAALLGPITVPAPV
jgi:dTDP-4-amino-4,6-dideoxygalactose transaminase